MGERNCATSTLLRPLWQRPDLYIIAVMIAYLTLGLLLAPDYGMTADEAPRISYAEASLQAYQTGISTGLLDEKGPFYGMLALIGGKAFQAVIAGWQFIDGWHYMTLVSFVIGIYFFYRLCLRLIRPWPAFAATLFFCTQPLIWGHAFMNPKDMPFMAFFIASVCLGLEMVDSIFPREPISALFQSWREIQPSLYRSWDNLASDVVQDWRTSSPRLRYWMVALFAVVVELRAVSPWNLLWIKWIVLQAYQASSTSWLGWVFSHIAQNSTSLPAILYVNKGVAFYAMALRFGEVGLGLLIAGLGLFVFPCLPALFLNIPRGYFSLDSRPWNGFLKWLAVVSDQISCEWMLASARLKGLLVANGLLLLGVVAGYWAVNPFRPNRLAWVQASALHNPLAYFWLALVLGVGLVITLGLIVRQVFPSTLGRQIRRLPHGRLLLAGCFLGFTSDIRTLGPAAGLLVGAYLLVKGGRKAIPALLEYVGIGAIVTYVFWPNLWIAPLRNYSHSLSEAADFNWTNTVLFDGKIYAVKGLPSNFIPTIFTLQLTEGALALMLVGVLLGSIYFWVKRGLRLDLLLLGVWLVAPIAAAILLDSTVYDNARQLIFALPPLFILGGLALQFLWEQKRARWAFVLLTLALVGQGVYWDVRLHPYEYIYYNNLVGGVRGAFRNYELDYWGVSFKPELEYLNKIAPQQAKIYMYGPNLIAPEYLRPDLRVVTDPTNVLGVKYALILNKRNKDLTIYPDSPVIFRVVRENSVLAVIKQIKPGDAIGK